MRGARPEGYVALPTVESRFRWITLFSFTVWGGSFDLTGHAERLFKRRVKNARIFDNKKRRRLGVSKHYIARDLAGTWR